MSSQPEDGMSLRAAEIRVNRKVMPVTVFCESVALRPKSVLKIGLQIEVNAMFSHPQQGIEQETVNQLRTDAGKWLRAMREATGISQRDLAKKVGLGYYTFISQIESGRGRIPPTQMRAWADALGMNHRDFAVRLMRFYDPINYEMIFAGGEAPTPPPSVDTDASLEDRLRRLEVLVANQPN